MALEIERKYLLSSPRIVELLSAEGLSLQKDEITQVYTRIDDDSEIRLRKQDDKFTMTSKFGQGMIRQEQEEIVSEKLFSIACENAIGDIIEKTRYSFSFEDFPICIDLYKGKLEGLSLLEIEFPDVQTANSYTLLELFKQEILKEVSDDKRYKNKYLALYGKPKLDEGLSLNEIYEGIKNSPLEFKFLHLLSPNINSYDALRLVFFSMLERIKFYQNSYLQSLGSEDLHQFRVNIRKTRSLLQSIDGIFDENIRQRFISDFKLIANATNSKRDMDVFKEYLKELDELEAEYILDILHSNEFNNQDALDMIESEFYAKTIEEWQMVLEDEDGFFKGQNAEFSYKKIGLNTICKRLKKMQKKLDLLDESVDIAHFHSLRIEFKKLRYLSEIFENSFKDKSISKMIKVSKRMQNLFGSLQDKDVGYEILLGFEKSDILAQNIEIMYSKDVIEEILKDEIYALRSSILYGKEKLSKVLTKCLKELKNIRI